MLLTDKGILWQFNIKLLRINTKIVAPLGESKQQRIWGIRNAFLATGLFLYSPKTSSNQSFSVVSASIESDMKFVNVDILWKRNLFSDLF